MSKQQTVISAWLFLILCAAAPYSMAEEIQEHPYELMICDYVKFGLYKVDKSGKVIWEHHPEGRVWDFVITKDNHLVFPIITKPFEVRCIDFEKKQQWSWSYRKDYREIINWSSPEIGFFAHFSGCCLI